MLLLDMILYGDDTRWDLVGTEYRNMFTMGPFADVIVEIGERIKEYTKGISSQNRPYGI